MVPVMDRRIQPILNKEKAQEYDQLHLSVFTNLKISGKVLQKKFNRLIIEFCGVRAYYG